MDGHTVATRYYGRSSGYCVDPIEKKPLNHFLPGSAVLSFGTAGHLGPQVPLHFTAFHPGFKMTGRPPAPAATQTRARRIAVGTWGQRRLPARLTLPASPRQ
jgi:pyruvate-formate lyase-activating enzyme